VCPLAFESIESGCDILRSPYLLWHDFEADRASQNLNLALLLHGCSVAGVKQDSQPAKFGNDLTQQFEPLASSIGRLDGQSRDVPARVREVRDEADANRINRNCKNDGNGSCRLL
jgi:hypothetical protein